MASRFTALPLTSGESFVLETDQDGSRWVILVDGGQSKKVGAKRNQLYKAIRNHCPDVTDKIDVAICTHRDHDHAGGFPAFVETWLSEGNDIGEFWLPGGWAGAVEFALTNPDRLVSMLNEGAGLAVQHIGESLRLNENDGKIMSKLSSGERSTTSIQSQIYDLCMASSREESETNEVVVQPEPETQTAPDTESDRLQRAANSWGFSAENWEAVQADLESSEIHTETLASRAQAYDQMSEYVLLPALIGKDGIDEHQRWVWRVHHKEKGNLQLARSLFKSSIDTAEAIRRIASAAAMLDIPVRWFDFAEFEKGTRPTGGNPRFLQPMNSVELRRVQRETDAASLFFKLTLTEQNVASLVFQRVETDAEPGVVFLGDSRLAFGVERPEREFDKYLVQPTRPIIYTAAHHGSRNNDHAYSVLAGWLPGLFESSIAIRNGGVWNQTLSGYLRIESRRCAQCHQCHGGDWSQLVQIGTNGAQWEWPPGRGVECGQPRRKHRNE